MWTADSLSDIEIADDTMQAGEAGAAVATFTELDENISDITSTGIMRSSSTPRDLGISVWGGRYVGNSIDGHMCNIVVMIEAALAYNSSNHDGVSNVQS